jgi:hypothetical protein
MVQTQQHLVPRDLLAVPVATFLMAILCGTDKPRCDFFLNMVLVSIGVAISSYGEIHFNLAGTAFQVAGILAEALRLVLTQILLQKKGLTLNPLTSLYYIAPCRCSERLDSYRSLNLDLSRFQTYSAQYHWIWHCTKRSSHLQLLEDEGLTTF